MTSANVINYRIERNGEVVGEHRQHLLCHTKWHRLLKYVPSPEYTITPYGLDEDEATWEGKTVKLNDFLRSKNNKFAIFTIQDMRRMVEYAEKQKALLEEWVNVSKEDSSDLKKRTQKAIWYNPL